MLPIDNQYRIPEGNYMRIKCTQCGKEFRVDKSEIYFDWDCVETDYDREMGEEHTFESNDAVVCPKCLEHIPVKFTMWEYPPNRFNTSEIEVSKESGELMKLMDISLEINFDQSDFGHCEDCGEYHRIDMETGLCPDCLGRHLQDSLSDR